MFTNHTKSTNTLITRGAFIIFTLEIPHDPPPPNSLYRTLSKVNKFIIAGVILASEKTALHSFELTV